MSEIEKSKELIEKNKQKGKLQSLVAMNKGGKSSFAKKTSQNAYQKGQKSLKQYVKVKHK